MSLLTNKTEPMKSSPAAAALFLATMTATTTALTSRARAEPIALGDGEKLEFRVGWGIFTHAGEITVAASAAPATGGAQAGTRVLTSLATSGIVGKLYKLEASGDCLFDGRDGRILTAETNSIAGKKHTSTKAVFDYANKVMRFEDLVRPQNNATLPLPKAETMDLITALVQTRAWAMKPGDARPIVAIFEDEFYELTVTALGYEKVKSPWGEVNALILAPAPSPGVEPKGMFKKGAVVRVWVSQDERRLPVKFQLGLKYGTGTAYLVKHTPPAAADAAVPSEARSLTIPNPKIPNPK